MKKVFAGIAVATTLTLVGLGGWLLVARGRHEQSLEQPRRDGIQWFATWASGRDEASRSGRPILLVAGAPSCAGVSGMW